MLSDHLEADLSANPYAVTGFRSTRQCRSYHLVFSVKFFERIAVVFIYHRDPTSKPNLYSVAA